METTKGTSHAHMLRELMLLVGLGFLILSVGGYLNRQAEGAQVSEPQAAEPAPAPAKSGKAGESAKAFTSAKECGACHPKQYQEWRGSMHAYAMTSPVFLAFNRTLQERTSGTLGTFCVRCHTPIGITLGEGPLLPNAKRRAISMEGVTCIVCHSIERVQGKVNGEIPFSPGVIQGPYYGPDESAGKDDPNRLIPETPHPSRRFPAIRGSLFCGQCHDVSSPGGVRNEEAFSEWKNSPWAREGVTCQDCHMGPEPGKPVPVNQRPLDTIVDPLIFPRAPKRHRANHSMTGPDHSIVKGFGQADLDLNDEQFAKHEAKLEEDRVRLLRNGAKIAVSHVSEIKAGTTLKVAVDVTNTFSGHHFPTGFTAERQVWLEVLLRDPDGNITFKSGDLDKYLDLRDHHSHEVHDGHIPRDAQLFNLQSRFINRNFRGTETEVLIPVNRRLSPVPFVTPPPGLSATFGMPFGGRILRNSIPARATKTANYKIPIPKMADGQFALSVRLRFRHLPPHLLPVLGFEDWVEISKKLRIVDIDSYRKEITVIPK